MKDDRLYLIHRCARADLTEVWQIVVGSLPALKHEVTALLRDLGGGEAPDPTPSHPKA